MSDNLISLYFSLYPSHADALRELNAEGGTAYRHDKISSWLRGMKNPNNVTQARMRRKVMSHAIREALGEDPTHYTDAQLDHLAALMGPPEGVL